MPQAVGAAGLAAVATAGTIDAGLVGSLLSYSLSVIGQLNRLVRDMSNAETQMSAVERTMEYGQLLQEAAAVIPNAVPDAWPSALQILQGQSPLTRCNCGTAMTRRWYCRVYLLQCLPERAWALRGEAAGGKSSTLAALLRLVELTAGTGAMDGVGIAKVGLLAAAAQHDHHPARCAPILHVHPGTFGLAWIGQ